MKFLKNLFFSVKKEICTKSAQETDRLNKERDAIFESARLASIISHDVVNAIHLKVGDIIIYKEHKVEVIDCGCGFDAGNEFGHYFWIKAKHISRIPSWNGKAIDFWLMQQLPVIRLKSEGI